MSKAAGPKLAATVTNEGGLSSWWSATYTTSIKNIIKNIEKDLIDPNAIWSRFDSSNRGGARKPIMIIPRVN